MNNLPENPHLPLSDAPKAHSPRNAQKELGVTPIDWALKYSRSFDEDNHFESKLTKDFQKKIINILKKYNINTFNGEIERGGFSWVIDIGEEQVIHLSSEYGSNKPHVRHHVPEILQPLTTLHDNRRLKIEILPKVKTE